MNPSFLDQFARVTAAQGAEVARRVAAGEAVPAMTAALGLDPVGIVAALARVGLGPDEADGPTLVQVAPTHPRLAEVVADQATIAALFPRAGRPARLALGAGLLQILDAWEASHTAAQGADDLGESATSAAWHMVAHRREPDPSNARYWARRVPARVFDPLIPLATRVPPTPGGDPDEARRIIDGFPPVWSPATMIDLCTRAEPGSAVASLARRLQRLEMLVLLGESAALVG